MSRACEVGKASREVPRELQFMASGDLPEQQRDLAVGAYELARKRFGNCPTWKKSDGAACAGCIDRATRHEFPK